MRSISRQFLLFCGLLTGLGLLSAGLPVGSGQAEQPPRQPQSPAQSEPATPPAESFAEPRVQLESAWLVADEAGGRVRLVDGSQPPGARERLYTARFRNEGGRADGGLQITVALPPEMRYVADSAVGPGAEISFSVDGGRNFAAPEQLTVPVDPDDPESAPRRATAADYSHIRWRLPGAFPPGTAGLVSFRARPAEPEADADPDSDNDSTSDPGSKPDSEPRPEPGAAAPAGTR